MITDKDREEALKPAQAIFEKAWGWSIYPKDISRIITDYVETKLDETRKEAAERYCEKCAKCEYDPALVSLCVLRAAILGDTPINEQKQTDAEKLTIAVKALKWALEYIGDGFLPEEGTPDHDCGYIIEPDNGVCDFCENYWIARDALKEIQG